MLLHAQAVMKQHTYINNNVQQIVHNLEIIIIMKQIMCAVNVTKNALNVLGQLLMSAVNVIQV